MKRSVVRLVVCAFSIMLMLIASTFPVRASAPPSCASLACENDPWTETECWGQGPHGTCHVSVPPGSGLGACCMTQTDEGGPFCLSCQAESH